MALDINYIIIYFINKIFIDVTLCSRKLQWAFFIVDAL